MSRCAMLNHPVRSFHSSSMKSGLIHTLKEKIADRKKPVVAIIQLHGIFQSGTKSSSSHFRSLNIGNMTPVIDKAFKTSNLKTVLLSINSPGGMPAQCELISDYIIQKAKERNIQVTSFVDDMAVSGGYWLACIGDQVYINKTSVLGSIGVISGSFGFNELISRYGIERRIYAAGNSKSFMDPFVPIKEPDELKLKEILDDVHSFFKDHVRTFRGDRIKACDEEKLFSGEFWVGQRAIDIGLADGFQNIPRYIESNLGGLHQVRIKRFNPTSSLFQGLLGTSSAVEQFSNLQQNSFPKLI